MRGAVLPRLSRRLAIRRFLGLVGGLSAGAVGVRIAHAQEELVTASGAGVNLKLMPDVDGNPTVPLRESFAFDSSYAQCIVEDNPDRFAMDTFGMGRQVIEPHTFFMAMHSTEMDIVSIRTGPAGERTAKLVGQLDCATFASTAAVTVGSRTATEHAFYEIEATDGGRGGGTIGDRFAFTVFFDPALAPVNHAIFGPKFTFTGDMIAGEVTIGPPAVRPLLG